MPNKPPGLVQWTGLLVLVVLLIFDQEPLKKNVF